VPRISGEFSQSYAKHAKRAVSPFDRCMTLASILTCSLPCVAAAAAAAAAALLRRDLPEENSAVISGDKLITRSPRSAFRVQFTRRFRLFVFPCLAPGL
jgi:hypothetical protein